MKNILLFIFISCISLANTFAQLPAAAQRLYDSAWAQDSNIVNFALNHNVQVIATPDGNSFYLQWFPNGSTPSTIPLITTLHGSNGNAFMEFFSWYPRANVHSCGIVALQWYRYRPTPPYDYFPDDTIYSYFDSALTKINYPSGKVLLHGFSRGSARSYAIVFKDIQSGKNYFCTTMSNSGGADSAYPLYAQINAGVYGTNVFAGKRWNMFCGGQDPNPNQSGCPGMSNTQTWLQNLGAAVDIFIQDANLGHNGFQLQSSFTYKDSILNNYLQCFNSTSVSEEQNKTSVSVFPNPSDGKFQVISSKSQILSIEIYNVYGENIYDSDLTLAPSPSGEGWGEVMDLSKQPSGIYFLQIKTKQGVERKKIIISK